VRRVRGRWGPNIHVARKVTEAQREFEEVAELHEITEWILKPIFYSSTRMSEDRAESIFTFTPYFGLLCSCSSLEKAAMQKT
jgi:hypothetical protein